MSIYKQRPHLSVDFEIQPFEVAFSSVVNIYRPQMLEILDLYHESITPEPISYSAQFDTESKRLYFSPRYQRKMLGRSNTQHNSGRPDKVTT